MNTLKLTEAAKIKAAAAYNSASDHFDAAPLAFWDRTGRRTIERLMLHPGAAVLDVGCGSGASALPAAERVGPSGRVIGVDLADRLLDLARAKAAQRGRQNVEFRLGDMTDLGYPDNSFDAVVSVFSIFFVPDMEAVVRELWRMVKPGGKLAITTWGPRFFEPAYSAWLEWLRAERPDLIADFNPWDRISSPEQVSSLMAAGGIQNAEVDLERGSQVLQSAEDWWTVVMGSGQRATVDALDAKSAARLRDHNVNWLRNNRIRAIETNVIYAIGLKQ
jgi:ubiquinone/menaquinone biosynthesis C-methylase UbiE